MTIKDKQNDFTPREREILEIFARETRTTNHISVSGIEVHSSTESMKECEAVIDRLIKKHSDYILLKRKQIIELGNNSE